MKRKQHTQKIKDNLKRKICAMKLGKKYYQEVEKKQTELFD